MNAGCRAGRLMETPYIIVDPELTRVHQQQQQTAQSHAHAERLHGGAGGGGGLLDHDKGTHEIASKASFNRKRENTPTAFSKRGPDTMNS